MFHSYNGSNNMYYLISRVLILQITLVEVQELISIVIAITGYGL